MSPSMQRLLLSVVPAALLVVLASVAVWGDGGFLARARLQARLDASNAELAQVQRANERLLFELRQMREDPIVLERVVAEEIGLAREHTTIVRFEAADRAP